MYIQIVHRLRRAQGSIAKKKVLAKHKDDKVWQAILLAMYDTSINYYITKVEDNTFKDITDVRSMLSSLKVLSSRAMTGNSARGFAESCSSQYGELFRLILAGSLKAGVSTTTINKIYPRLIPIFPLMLAQDAEVKNYPMLVSTKYDGVRLLAFVDVDKKTILKTRSGKRIQIDSLIAEMDLQDSGVYDGELVSGDGKQAGRSTITGAVNKCLKGSATDIRDYTYCIFDWIHTVEWKRQECNLSYNERYRQLYNYLVETNNIKRAEQSIVYNDKEVEVLFKDRIDKGYEGLILRSANDLYVWRRSDALIKKKATYECVLDCVGVKPGTGKYEGMIGAVICEGKIDDKYIRVNIGSGLSDWDRTLTCEHFMGNKIEILYNDIVSPSESDTYSLFLPRFKRILGEI